MLNRLIGVLISKKKHHAELVAASFRFADIDDKKFKNSYSPHHNDLKHKNLSSQFTAHRSLAFTLAEVLITLGIIGVVAAMTIPTLIQNSQKQETVTKLEKMYSIINQAAKMSELENGSMITWAPPIIDYDSIQSIDWWNTYFLPYSNLSITKTCSKGTSGCWTTNSKFLDGSDSNVIWSSYGGIIILSDGSIINFQAVNSSGAQIYVDINGFKGPNVWGKDIFYIVVSYKAGSVGFGVNGVSRAYLLENHNATCNKSPGIYKGDYCGALIQMDGWTIADDYPW